MRQQQRNASIAPEQKPHPASGANGPARREHQETPRTSEQKLLAPEHAPIEREREEHTGEGSESVLRRLRVWEQRKAMDRAEPLTDKPGPTNLRRPRRKGA